jgi:uncharacterized membrane protein
MINKMKNPYFWVSIVALFFASAQIDVESLTTWSILQQKLIEFIKNPYLVGVFIVALIGVYNDNSTPKLDKLK